MVQELVALKKLDDQEITLLQGAIDSFRQANVAETVARCSPLMSWSPNRLLSTLAMVTRALLHSLGGDERLPVEGHVDFLSRRAAEASHDGIGLSDSRSWAALGFAIDPEAYTHRLNNDRDQLVTDLCATLAHLGAWASGSDQAAEESRAEWFAKIEAPVSLAWS